MSDKTLKSPAVPYVSWKTFVNYLQSLQQSIPNRIDTSGMLTLSGSNRTLVMAALKFFVLIDESGKPQETLEPLVNSYTTATMGEFQKKLRQLLEKYYPPLFISGFDLKTATPSHFSEQFGKMEIAGDTGRKAQTFFLEAAKAAGISISSTILATRGKGKRTGPPRPRNTRNEGGQNNSNPPPPPVDPKPPVQELPAWYSTFKPAFDKLPEFGKAHWTSTERERWIVLVTALVDAYVDVDDAKKK